jgi:cobalt-zinc-cadmium efflux system protein
MAHNHADHHGQHHHGHDHAPQNFGRAFAIGLVLNVAFVTIEVIFGLVAGSTALLADAGHNLSDVLGLLLAWGGTMLAKRAATKRFTYGYKGSTILAALFNSLLLLVALGAIGLEAVQRVVAPSPVAGGIVSLVALVGVVINGITAWMFSRGRHDDLNIRGAYLHMLADAAVSAGVVVSGLLVIWTGQSVIDPLTSLVIVAYIFCSTWDLLRQSLAMTMAAVPPHIDLAKVEAELRNSHGVTNVHDLHVWHMSTTEVALTAHIAMPGGHPGDAFLAEVQRKLAQDYAIHHATIQIETGDNCAGIGSGCA